MSKLLVFTATEVVFPSLALGCSLGLGGKGGFYEQKALKR